MTLSSMVVSRDWQEISVLECILGGLHIDVAVEDQTHRALHRLNKSKVDALIVDCDLDGSSQFLRTLQRAPLRQTTVPLVIMRNTNSGKDLDDTGALFAFQKPISVEQAVHTLSAARNLIVDGRLRYHRAGLKLPVMLRAGKKNTLEAQLVNLSQGGLQIHADRTLDVRKAVSISLDLPEADCCLKAQGQVAWRDQRGHIGIQFVKVAPRIQKKLQLWLAQQYFAN
ncbi:MAG TPA: PilZ domain-containing protein [Candidatus Sulfotelmatobacter sp.]|nr:PilZ domain-containing protein [Candidatus Sulfotelmatobacter sp.]